MSTNDKAATLALLSRQQINILELSSQGLRAAAVAARLAITEKTVKFHKTNIYKVLAVTNIVQALLKYEALTSDADFRTFEATDYQTPAYTKLQSRITELQQRYDELRVANTQLREDYKALVISNALKGATHKMPQRKNKVAAALPELVSGQGTGTANGSAT